MINLKLEERLFESAVLSFQVRASDPQSHELVEDAMLEYAGQHYFITSVEDTIDERGVALKTVEAEIGWMRLADLKRVGSFHLENRTAQEGLTAILNGYDWTAGPCFVTDDFSYEGQDLTLLALVWDWCRTVGGEPTFDSLKKEIRIDEVAGAHRGLSFRYGRNLKTIKRISKPPEFTRIYAYGRNGMDIKGSTGGLAYVEDYTWYTSQGLSLDEAKARYQKDDVYSDDSIVSETALYAAALARLSVTSRPTISYTAGVLNLSHVSGLDESYFTPGDFATVYDEIEGTTLEARIVRRVQWPNEPEKDEVELAFNNVLLPNPQATSQRANQTKSWELFQRVNTGPRQVRANHTLLSRIKLQYIEGAEWVCGYSLEGVAVGNSTLTIEFTDDETEEAYWQTQVVTLVDGETYRFNFTRAKKDISAGQEILVVRAYTDSTTAGLNIDTGLTDFWVLARGTTSAAVTLENSIRFDAIGAIQRWQVPDDITEIQLEVAAAGGGSQNPNGAAPGGMVRGKLPVIAGSWLDIYVGGRDYNVWPNGGAGDSVAGATGYSGGGSSDVRPADAGYVETYLMAGAGGGSGQHFSSNPQRGGAGGFYQGQPTDEIDSPGKFPGGPATQTAGGAGNPGGSPGFCAGENGTAFRGGRAGDATNSFTFPPGGGGGGWYGGGGGGSSNSSGAGEGGGGGGGSGWAHEAIFDLETFDGSNLGDGYVIISWDDPPT